MCEQTSANVYIRTIPSMISTGPCVHAGIWRDCSNSANAPVRPHRLFSSHKETRCPTTGQKGASPNLHENFLQPESMEGRHQRCPRLSGLRVVHLREHTVCDAVAFHGDGHAAVDGDLVEDGF